MTRDKFGNDLSNAELERLAILSEECSEVIKVINKTIRRGYSSSNPEITNSPTNREDLEREVGDVLWVISLMGITGDISLPMAKLDQGRQHRKERYLQHQQKVNLDDVDPWSI